MIFALKNSLDELNIKLAQLLIWVKNHAVVGRLDYLPQHELIAYGWYGRHSFAHSKDKSVLFYPKPSKSKLHPTMKPIGLLRKLVLNSSKINDLVYDPFLGSGSTLIACEQAKRRCYGIELSPDYCQVIIDRFEKLTGVKAVKV
jgi:site-specific DNA-methyltransferase (adenine-specific)